MSQWFWFILATGLVVACYAFLGSFSGGMFGAADAEPVSDRGHLIRRIGMIVLALLVLYSFMGLVAAW